MYIGTYAKCKLKPGCSSVGIHWLLDERDEETVREKTSGRAGVNDLIALRDAHFAFPEFMYDKHKFAYIVLPGYTKLDDISRCDSFVEPVAPASRTIDENTAFVDTLIKVFNFESVELCFGAVMEVV
jgi:hypothetical protein